MLVDAAASGTLGTRGLVGSPWGQGAMVAESTLGCVSLDGSEHPPAECCLCISTGQSLPGRHVPGASFWVRKSGQRHGAHRGPSSRSASRWRKADKRMLGKEG